MQDCSSCDVCDNLHEQVTDSTLLFEDLPMFSAHAEGTRVTESRHSSECVWNQLGNLSQEEVRHGSLGSDCTVWVCWVETSLGNLLSDWYWWDISGSSQRAGQFSAPKRSSWASRKCAQLLSEALTAGRPKRSQLLSTRTFHAGSEANEEGP